MGAQKEGLIKYPPIDTRYPYSGKDFRVLNAVVCSRTSTRKADALTSIRAQPSGMERDQRQIKLPGVKCSVQFKNTNEETVGFADLEKALDKYTK